MLEHAMKVVEWIFEHRIRQQIEIDDMQFVFMKGKGTTDAILWQERLSSNCCFIFKTEAATIMDFQKFAILVVNPL